MTFNHISDRGKKKKQLQKKSVPSNAATAAAECKAKESQLH